MQAQEITYRHLRFCQKHQLGRLAARKTILLYRKMLESFLLGVACDDAALLQATGVESWDLLAACLEVPALNTEKGRITFLEAPQPGSAIEELLACFHHTNLRWEV